MVKCKFIIFDHNLRLTMYLSLIILNLTIYLALSILYYIGNNFDHIFEFDHISDSSLTIYLSLPIQLPCDSLNGGPPGQLNLV